MSAALGVIPVREAKVRPGFAGPNFRLQGEVTGFIRSHKATEVVTINKRTKRSTKDTSNGGKYGSEDALVICCADSYFLAALRASLAALSAR